MTAHLLRWFLCSSWLACAACGGLVSDDAAGSASSDGADSLVGSYTLVLESAERTGGEEGGIRLDGGTVGNAARLDIQRTAEGGLEAILTPRWGRSSTLDVEGLSPALELIGEVSFPRADRSADAWTSLRLAFDRRRDGALAGTFALSGTLRQPDGDWTWKAQVSGKGSVRPDDVAPEMRIGAPLPSRGGKWLPWDDVTVELSEPLGAAPFADTFRSLAEHAWPASGAPGEVTFFLGAPDGALAASGPRWIRSPEGVKDRRANALGPFEGEVVFHDVGRQNDAFTFHPEVDLAKWGGAARIDDAHCEKGGCMIVPQDDEYCSAPAGFAGIVTPTRPVTVLRARMRFFTSEEQGAARAETGLQVFLPTTIEIFAKGTRPRGVVAGASPLILTRTGEDPSMPWTTEWRDMEFPLPADAEEVGFSVHKWTCDAGAIGITAGALVVDEIRLE